MIRKYQLIICWKTWIWIILTIYFWFPKFHVLPFCWHSFSPHKHWTLKVKKGSLEDERLGTYRITHEKKGTWSETNFQGIMLQPLIFRGVLEYNNPIGQCCLDQLKAMELAQTSTGKAGCKESHSRQCIWIIRIPLRSCRQSPVFGEHSDHQATLVSWWH